MITAIRSNNFNNYRCSSTNSKHDNYKNTVQNSNLGDTVSFSGSAKAATKLSEQSFSLIKKFSCALEPNKMYKFAPSNAERFQLASVASKAKPNERNLYVQYSAYTDSNSAKYLMFSINDTGEVFENGNLIKSKKDISLYESLMPELINKASKELKLDIK